MGDKLRAKAHVAAHGVPVIPGAGDAGMSDAELIDAGSGVGFPLIIKPSAGGGGKGMTVVERQQDLADGIAAARRIATAAFGDDTLLLERFLPSPRHIEVQVLADTHGTTLHLGERECSLQRRHQKVIEEAPSPLLDASPWVRRPAPGWARPPARWPAVSATPVPARSSSWSRTSTPTSSSSWRPTPACRSSIR